MLGEYYTEDDSQLAQLAAMQYYIEYGSEISEEGLTALLKSYIPEATLQVSSLIPHVYKYEHGKVHPYASLTNVMKVHVLYLQ